MSNLVDVLDKVFGSGIGPDEVAFATFVLMYAFCLLALIAAAVVGYTGMKLVGVITQIRVARREEKRILEERLKKIRRWRNSHWLDEVFKEDFICK